MEDSIEDCLKMAVRNKEFQGLMFFVVRDGDVFEIDASEYKVHHRLGPYMGKILGAWARCDRKNKMPFLIYLEFEEHKEVSITYFADLNNFMPTTANFKEYVKELYDPTE